MGRVARFVHESWKRLVNASPLATLFDRPLHLAAVPEAKQSNQNVLSFQLGFCSAIIPPEFGAAGILEAPIFTSRIGSGGAHKANRFLARLFFCGLFVGFRVTIPQNPSSAFKLGYMAFNGGHLGLNRG